jgi:hypothetical protein
MKIGLEAASDSVPALAPAGTRTVTAWVWSTGYAGARVEQVGVALAVDFEEALVVAGGADRFAVGEFDRGQRSGLARVLDADAPGFRPPCCRAP